MNSPKCPQCDLVNVPSSSNCQRCGYNLTSHQSARTTYQQNDYAPPPSYSNAPYPNSIIPMANMNSQTTGFRCPFCNSSAGAVITSKTSGAGWVVVILLLLFCLPLFWIGFFIKEQSYICRSCGMKIG